MRGWVYPFAWLVSSSGWALPGHAAEGLARPLVISPSATFEYRGQGSEAAEISAWIRHASPANGPLLAMERIVITRTGRGFAMQRESSGSPALPLPGRGRPGETITIRNDRANGAHESWTYAWSGQGPSGWTLVAYAYNAAWKPGVPPQRF